MFMIHPPHSHYLILTFYIERTFESSGGYTLFIKLNLYHKIELFVFSRYRPCQKNRLPTDSGCNGKQNMKQVDLVRLLLPEESQSHVKVKTPHRLSRFFVTDFRTDLYYAGSRSGQRLSEFSTAGFREMPRKSAFHRLLK